MVVRYVDDVIAASFELCDQCLQQRLRLVYPGLPLEIVHSSCGNTEVDWLSMRLVVRDGMLELHGKREEVEWALGDVPEPKKIRVPAWADARRLQRQQYLARAQSMRALWKQQGLQGEALSSAMHYEVLLWCRSGVPLPALKAYWRHCGDAQIAQQIRVLAELCSMQR